MDRMQIEKLLGSSTQYTFFIENKKVQERINKIDFQYRGQEGWDGISQKICVADGGNMSMGISVIKAGGSMQEIQTVHEFVDFLLYNNGTVTVDGIGELPISQGDFLNFKQNIIRSSGNMNDDIVVGIWYQKARPSYEFSR